MTGKKDGKTYAFACRYDIDAINGSVMEEFINAAKKPGVDVLVFMTNSSFSTSAKKAGDAAGVELWDRNYIDRMSIGVDVEYEKPVVKEKSHLKLYIAIAAVVVVVLIAALALYFSFLCLCQGKRSTGGTWGQVHVSRLWDTVPDPVSHRTPMSHPSVPLRQPVILFIQPHIRLYALLIFSGSFAIFAIASNAKRTIASLQHEASFLPVSCRRS